MMKKLPIILFILIGLMLAFLCGYQATLVENVIMKIILAVCCGVNLFSAMKYIVHWKDLTR